MEQSKTEKNLFSMNLNDMSEYLVGRGYSKFAASQVFDWIYKRKVLDPNNWSNVSKALKNDVLLNMSIDLPKVVWNGLSTDGTRKFLLKMQDGETIESVVIAANKRRTLCLSSQVGCAIGCTFCHTGTMGLKRHLGSHEIVGQFLTISLWLLENGDEGESLSNVVYMGQGEPLHNYQNVKQSVEIFMEPKGLGIGQRKITLSTSGLVPQIQKLNDFPPVNIAISLHATHNEMRTELMPINKVYDLERLFEAIKTIPLKGNRKITYEYILIDSFNDTKEDIKGLDRLIDKTASMINIIPFNEYPSSNFKAPSNKKALWFRNELLGLGHNCTIRISKGQDILAACGQLKSEKEKLNLW
jgi:23S rRNA (adenine2503-C2)-methyltransferase